MEDNGENHASVSDGLPRGGEAEGAGVVPRLKDEVKARNGDTPRAGSAPNEVPPRTVDEGELSGHDRGRAEGRMEGHPSGDLPRPTSSVHGASHGAHSSDLNPPLKGGLLHVLGEGFVDLLSFLGLGGGLVLLGLFLAHEIIIAFPTIIALVAQYQN